ncbi:MAG: hypothetical protein MUC92_13885 [Fimbriimonadaceae bacterium]|nr:hypothetical protein [Fimbriimonadaceae bacterium]
MLTTIKDWSIVAAGMVALITLITGLVQYVRQARLLRVQQFVDMRRRFLENPTFREILNLLATDNSLLREVPIQDRRNLVGFLEELALMVNSGVIRPEVAHYMFGYYTKLIAESKHFWEGLDRDSDYWTVFWNYAEQKKALARIEKSRGREHRLMF